jgi:hypothetical protein
LPGTYSSTGSSNCTICPSGSYCPGGEFNITQCPTGKDTGMDGASSVLECTFCAAGYYLQNGTCTLCPLQFYCPGRGIETKLACPGNATSPTGSASGDDCICRSGFQRDINATCSDDVCFTCAVAIPASSVDTLVVIVMRAAIGGLAAIVVLGGAFSLTHYLKQRNRVQAHTVVLESVSVLS